MGIGYGSATLFGQLGLQISDEHCTHFTSLPSTLTITKSELIGAPKTDETMIVMEGRAGTIPRFNKDGERITDFFAVFLPSSDSATSSVDVIARWSSTPNFAPIVRQGNCVFVGIASPATLWTKSYATLIGETCMALHQRKLEEFSTIRRALTKPGKYEFQLAPRNSTDKPFVKNFYFQFSQPSKLRAELVHSGSANVSLLFYGQNLDGFNGVGRQDAFKGENLTIEAAITAEDIEQIGERYWILKVTNFDANAEVSCTLTITTEVP